MSLRRATVAATLIALTASLISPLVPYAGADELPVPSIPLPGKKPIIPDPVAPRNGRTGFVILPPDPNTGTFRTGITPLLGRGCLPCQAADVWGGDVAVSWDDGKGGTFIIFGDTIGKNYYKNSYVRSNTLAYTRDKFYFDGITIEKFLLGPNGKAKEAIPSMHRPGIERSKIPTGAFSYKGVQYVGWQSVARLVRDSRKWTTSRSGLSASYDHGKTWHTVLVRPQGKFYRFQQVSYAIKDNYLYQFGTRQGREAGALSVARVPLNKITDLSAHEYWTGLRWVPNAPRSAFGVLMGIKGELSVQYDPVFRRFLMLRGERGGVALASSLDGILWTPGRMIYSPQISNHDLYSPQLLPHQHGASFNFLLSVWQDYNVVSMFSPVGI